MCVGALGGERRGSRVACEAEVEWFVLEVDAYPVAECGPGQDDWGAVAIEVQHCVGARIAEVAGEGVGGRSPWR